MHMTKFVSAIFWVVLEIRFCFLTIQLLTLNNAPNRMHTSDLKLSSYYLLFFLVLLSVRFSSLGTVMIYWVSGITSPPTHTSNNKLKGARIRKNAFCISINNKYRSQEHGGILSKNVCNTPTRTGVQGTKVIPKLVTS